jgi:hypothetical protein
METRSSLDRHAGEVLAEVYALLARRGSELRATEDNQPVSVDTVPAVQRRLDKVVRRRRMKTPKEGK